MTILVGLDLSMRGLGLVAVPLSWDLDWKRVRFKSLEYKLRKDATTVEEVTRLKALSRDVRKWCLDVGATEVWAEHLAAHQGFSVVQLAELRAAVRLRLWASQFDVKFVPEMTARKLLLGWVPAKDRKAHVVEALKIAGDPFDYDDERDAFAIANYALHEHGAPCLHDLLGPKPVKPKAPRTRAKNRQRAEVAA